MKLTHAVQWTQTPGRIDRGPRTGPLSEAAAQHMARDLTRMWPRPAEVRVIALAPSTAQLPLFRGAR